MKTSIVYIGSGNEGVKSITEEIKDTIIERSVKVLHMYVQEQTTIGDLNRT